MESEKHINLISRESDIKSFLFSRWLVTNYTTDVLNSMPGVWWMEQLLFFNDQVLPNYIKNGTVNDAFDFFNLEGKEWKKIKK